MSSTITKAYLELTFAMVIVGSSIVAGKIVISSFPVFLASGLRFALASALLVPFLYYREKGFPPLARQDLCILFLQSFAGAFLFNVFLLYGLRFTTATESGIITATTPAVIGVLSHLLLGERLAGNKYAGIILAGLGILAVSRGSMFPLPGGDTNPLLGNALVFGAVIGEALFTVLGKAESQKVSPLAMSAIMSLIAFALFLPFSLYEAIHFDFSRVPLQGWMLIAYYAVVVTAVSFPLWYGGVAKVPASTSGVFTGVLPVSAALFSYAVLIEPFRWPHLAGILCVLAGIAFIARERET